MWLPFVVSNVLFVLPALFGLDVAAKLLFSGLVGVCVVALLLEVALVGLNR